MDGISRSRGWDKEIPHGVLPMEQLVLSDKWARKRCLHRDGVHAIPAYSGNIRVSTVINRAR